MISASTAASIPNGHLPPSSANAFTTTYEPDRDIPGNGTTIDSSGDTTVSQHSGCWGRTGAAQAQVGPHSTYESHTNADGSTDVVVNGDHKTYQGQVDFDQQNHAPLWDQLSPPAESTTTHTSGRPFESGLGGHSTTTTTHSVGGSSVETTEETSRPDFGGEFTTAGKTTIRVGANDNVNVSHEPDGSAIVTINGVEQHLSPEQARNIEIIKDRAS